MAVDIKKYLRKTGPLYHALSVLHVYLNRHSQLCDVPIDICVNPMGFSFGPGGWNCLIEQLKEFDQGRELEITDSILYKFHHRYQPGDMSDIPVSAGFRVVFKPGLVVYPWGSFNVKESKRGGKTKDVYDLRLLGPSSSAAIEKDLLNLKSLYEYMRTYGYRPWHFRNAFIGGVFLERADGQKRFVVLQGNHRTAILAHLGCESMKTRYLNGYYKCISEKDMADWFYVKSGACSEQDAKAYFDSFFVLNGRERAKKMGFDS